jgi:sialidase-1
MVCATWVHGKGGKTAWWSAGPGFEPAETPQLLMTRSSDDGRTWSAPVNLTRQVKQPQWLFTFQAPGRGITMADGTLVVPFQHQEPDRTPAAGIMYSRDHGVTWTVSADAKSNTTESQVAEIEPGVLLLSIRDNRGTGRALYVTRDMGRSWTPHAADGQLPDPVCMASLLHVPAAGNCLGRDILLFANPADEKERRNLTLRISFDGGVTWPGSVLVDAGDSWGYSCLTMVDPETVGILYEGSQAHITFQAIPLRALIP